MSSSTYVLITPARNEGRTIEITIKSVLNQTMLPAEWIIVSDQSVDDTDEIVKKYAVQYPFIRLLRRDGEGERSFASVVRATEAGINALQCRNYDYLCLLDADVQFAPDYFALLMAEFGRAPRLGLGGGLVIDVVDGEVEPAHQDTNEVAGATQFFRRDCFESLNGLLAIPEGGWDAITCIRARMNGFETRTFRHLQVKHLKRRNAAFGHPLNRKWQMGMRDYVLASHPLFEIAKCCSRIGETPVIIGAAVRLAGYFWSGVVRRKRILPPDLRKRLRDDQIKKLSEFFRGFLGRNRQSAVGGSLDRM
jgi:glycosyltransferase involved in cell wall biosynthesis